MEGVQKTEVKSAVLNPSAEGGEEFTLTSDFVMFCSLLHFHPPNFFFTMLTSVTGTQTVIFDKVSLESVVPHSVPETFINIRGEYQTQLKLKEPSEEN